MKFSFDYYIFIFIYKCILNTIFKVKETIFAINNRESNDVIHLLEKIMNDTTGDIDYYIYELNYGKDYHPGDIVVNDQNIDFSNPSSLYDYLIGTNFDWGDV